MVEYLTQKQLDQLLELAKAPRDHLMIEVLYQTGCTVSELVSIKDNDVSDNSITIEDRSVIVSKDLCKKIRSFAKNHESPFVFASRQAEHVTPKRVQQIIKDHLLKLPTALEKTTPHLLRYTHIAHAVQQRIPFSAIMNQTGLQELRLSQIVSEISTPDQDAYRRMFS